MRQKKKGASTNSWTVWTSSKWISRGTWISLRESSLPSLTIISKTRRGNQAYWRDEKIPTKVNLPSRGCSVLIFTLIKKKMMILAGMLMTRNGSSRRWTTLCSTWTALLLFVNMQPIQLSLWTCAILKEIFLWTTSPQKVWTCVGLSILPEFQKLLFQKKLEMSPTIDFLKL